MQANWATVCGLERCGKCPLEWCRRLTKVGDASDQCKHDFSYLLYPPHRVNMGNGLNKSVSDRTENGWKMSAIVGKYSDQILSLHGPLEVCFSGQFMSNFDEICE